jgi:CubicO group peptidase (beta-lactamase class C family)
MKFILVFALAVLATINPLNAINPNNAIKDSIVSRFNRGDLKGIYAMADSAFRKEVTEEHLIGLLNGAVAFGKIVKTEWIEDDSDHVSSYKLFFTKKTLRLNVRAATASSYDNFGLSFYKLPVVRTRAKFPSDNPMLSPLDSAVQQAVSLFMSNKNVAGLSIGVIKDGKAYTYHFGEIKKGSGRLPGDNTIYEIGSVTKTFTGILLAHAVCDGKLKLTDDIRKWLNGKFPNLQFDGHPITIASLSNHTSGLPSQPEFNKKDIFDPSLTFTAKMLNDILHKVKLDTLPGAVKNYSNFATGLLGLILEKVYGMNYESMLKKFIFVPYAMNDTKISFSKPDHQNYAQGYDVEGKPTSYWRNRIAEPAGGIRSTVQDMMLYMRQQWNMGDSAAWLSHQLTFGNHLKQGTGLGWGISRTKAGHLRWSHDGGTDGFTSLCLVYPEIKSAIILFTNYGDHDDPSFWGIKDEIYSSLLKNIK